MKEEVRKTKIAIVYKSITGNTKIIAEEIKKALKEREIIYFGEPKSNIEADIYIVGSWTDKGECSKEIKSFLVGLNNKKIAYFGTAGFGGSAEYYQTLFSRIKENINDTNQLLGYFYCQGKMPISIRNRYEQLIKEHPKDKKLQVSIKNFDEALEHPNKEDIEQVKLWTSSIIK
ncbi:MAG: flavodoxin family protein BilS [Clostridia bacterium]